MTFSDYQALARRTQNTKLTQYERKMHALFGISSEVGEIHGIFQKHYQGHDVDYRELIKEMGDLMWFVSELCDVIGIDLESVCAANIAKLRERYPDGFDAEASKCRYEKPNEAEWSKINSIISRLEDDSK